MNRLSERDIEGANWFHISTQGMDRSLFKCPQDFEKCLNIIAICAIRHHVRLIAYCLMSNHIHLAAQFPEEAGPKNFINRIKQNYSRYFKQTYGTGQIFDRVTVSIKELKTMQYLKNCISYILRNPVEAKICQNADQYPWSSYNCYFKSETSPAFKDVNSLSVKTVKRTLKTNSDLRSSGLVISEEGNILPESFITTDFVQELFGNSRDELSKCVALNPYLALEYELTNTRGVELPHYELVKITSELSEKKFGKRLSLLSVNERITMVFTLYKEYNASPYQICQLLSLGRKTVNQILSLPSEK